MTNTPHIAVFDWLIANRDQVLLGSLIALGLVGLMLVARTIGPFVASPAIANYTFKFDEAAGTARIEATGLSYTSWERDNERWKLSLDKVLSGNNFSPDRTRPASTVTVRSTATASSRRRSWVTSSSVPS